MTRAAPAVGRGCRTPRDPLYFEAGPDGTLRNEDVTVFLNGRPCPLAVMAHAGKGWVTSRVIGADGMVATDGLGRPQFATEHGRVELRRCN